jgi:hypothetical protein
MNRIYSDYLDTLKISHVLLSPNCTIIYENDIINQCLEANSIYASRKGNCKELIVTHSNKSSISIGTVVVKIDSILVDQLSDEAIVILLQNPNRIIEFAMPSEDAINYDAKQNAKQYDSFTQFDICGVCAVEYGPIHLRPIVSNINVFYSNLLESLTSTDSTRCDTQYAIALQAEITTRGVPATAKYICTFCLKQMKRTIKRQQSTMNDDDPTTISQTNSLYVIPKESILNGHFAGAIPDELLNLTDIEKTMISIYSPVTKYSLCTKEHFRINGATSYTIVNDLFTIANQLPKKIDPSTIGILQTRSRKLNSNYTFRPLIAKSALTWLKLNNHLYHSVDLHWYKDNFDWDSVSEVDIPVIELTDEDELQIDKEL